MNLTALREDIDEVRHRLENDAADLRGLASSAIRMGNYALGRELGDFAQSLVWASKRLDGAYGNFLNNAYNDTMATFGRTISAILDDGDDQNAS